MNDSDRRSEEEWEALAPYWIARCRRGEPNREGMLDAWMWRVLGDVAGLRVVDLGCGEGRFCRQLAARGAAHVLGVDRCRPLLDAARAARTGRREAYLRDDVQRLDRVPSGAFDLAVSYVTLVDVPDLEAAVAAAARVLRPGGRFVACNLAPMSTATGERFEEPDGARVALRVDRYFEESARTIHFGSHALTNYHRTLSTYLDTFLSAGFRLASLHEPFPDAADLPRHPSLANELRAPSFVIYELEQARPSTTDDP